VLSSPVWRGTSKLAFGVGLLVGGALSATALVLVGSLVRAPLPRPARWALVAAACAVVLLGQAGVVRLRLPENRRLVPESVLRLGRHLGPLQFGIEMGTGVRTYLPSGLPYAAAVAVLCVASLPAALGAGAGFGLGRALMTASALRYGEDGGWSAQWRRYRRPLALLTAAAFTAALLAVAWLALGPARPR
jgi:hypothetical protein